MTLLRACSRRRLMFGYTDYRDVLLLRLCIEPTESHKYMSNQVVRLILLGLVP